MESSVDFNKYGQIKINSSQGSLTGSSQENLTGHPLYPPTTYQSSQVNLTGLAKKQSRKLDTINTLTMVHRETDQLWKGISKEPFMQSRINANHFNTQKRLISSL